MIGIDAIIASNGVGVEWTIIIILLVASLVLFATNFIKGLLLEFIIYGAVTMWFYNADYNWSIPLILMIIHLGLLALSLYLSAKSSDSGIGVI